MSRKDQEEVLVWYAMCHGAYCAMSDHERARLKTWEDANVGGEGGMATSDWPGWERILGRPSPWRE